MKIDLTLFFGIFFITLPFSSSSTKNASATKCLQDQTSVLLRFKEEFSLDFDDYSNPKTESWNNNNNTDSDCCSWDGVKCSDSGHVVGLDLSEASLRGPLTLNSSLFSLTRLERLNLAYNDFNHSEIPRRIGRDLPRLTHLNLSRASFSGRVPEEMSWLKNLVSLDLSGFDSDLVLEKEFMAQLVRNVTGLKELNLNAVNLSSVEVEAFGNFSYMEALSLSECDLAGEFPEGIFKLPSIKSIYAPSNLELRGSIPEFPTESQLESLVLESTGFSGLLPSSIRNLKSLKVLDLSNCGFSGLVPSSLGDLSELTNLDLSNNKFSGEVPSSLRSLTRLETLLLSKNRFGGKIPVWLGNLTQLTELELSYNEFSGTFPVSLANLTGLATFVISYNRLYGLVPTDIRNIPSSASIWNLDLSNNAFNGTIPSTLFELPSLTSLILNFNNFSGSLTIPNTSSSQLSSLNLRRNRLSGKIPSSISNLTSLTDLYLSANEFSGKFEFEKTLSNLVSLKTLDLAYNSENLSITFSDPNLNLSVPMFSNLGLASCGLTEFPIFLKNQTELWQLDLTENRIEGRIPNWFLATGKDSMQSLYLSNNLISGWEEKPSILPWNELNYLDLHGNRLRGSLIPPNPSLLYYFISNNSLSGEIYQSFCDRPNLRVLDASENNLSGVLPPCLGLNSSLLMLNLKRNSFSGEIPETCSEGSTIQTVDLSRNKLHGTVPRSLEKCRELEVLNIGHNQISDEFPFWTQNFPKLHVLVLRNNDFHGPMWHYRKFQGFKKLQIIDISHNDFSGNLPTDYFRNWTAINTKIPGENKSTVRYVGNTDNYYQNSLTLDNKGLSMNLKKILTTLMAVDLSDNRFSGQIPVSAGELKALKVLNLSSNGFEGPIPSSLGGLTELESLDLSNNELSGEIPRELVSLTFLSYLNLSENGLGGKIPEGRQFSTFPNSSYGGNPGLCGFPLTRTCGPTTNATRTNLDRQSENSFGWKTTAAIGCGVGLVIGLVAEHLVGLRRPNWLPGVYTRITS